MCCKLFVELQTQKKNIFHWWRAFQPKLRDHFLPLLPSWVKTYCGPCPSGAPDTQTEAWHSREACVLHGAHVSAPFTLGSSLLLSHQALASPLPSPLDSLWVNRLVLWLLVLQRSSIQATFFDSHKAPGSVLGPWRSRIQR